MATPCELRKDGMQERLEVKESERRSKWSGWLAYEGRRPCRLHRCIKVVDSRGETVALARWFKSSSRSKVSVYSGERRRGM
jgi:hypothetical protein